MRVGVSVCLRDLGFAGMVMRTGNWVCMSLSSGVCVKSQQKMPDWVERRILISQTHTHTETDTQTDTLTHSEF